MNILIVIADLNLGGAQQVVINLSNELSKRNHKVWIYDVYPELRMNEVINKIDKKIQIVNGPIKFNFLYKIMNSFLYRLGINYNYKKDKINSLHFCELKKILKNNSIDIINSHVVWADMFVLQNLQEYKNKWWVSLHGSYSNLIKRSDFIMYKNSAINVFNSCKGIFYLSETEKNNINRYIAGFSDKENLIFNGIPEPIFTTKITRDKLDIDNDNFVILCASRAILEKGWKKLIEAIEILDRNDITLIFAGDGPIFTDYKSRYENNNIRFLGYRNDIYDLIKISNCVALISETEALPTILIESIFQHKPVISTDVGSTKFIIQNQNLRAGVLLSPTPSSKEICNGILQVINPINYEEFVHGASNIKNQFKIEKMVDDYIKCFNI